MNVTRRLLIHLLAYFTRCSLLYLPRLSAPPTWAGLGDRTDAASAAEVPQPSVTILLTVHNEEHRIVETIKNLIALDYNRNQLEILVASDGSTDRTNDLVRGQTADIPVRLLVFERVGKSEAQNRAITKAQGEIIAFRTRTARWQAIISAN